MTVPNPLDADTLDRLCQAMDRCNPTGVAEDLPHKIFTIRQDFGDGEEGCAARQEIFVLLR